MPVYDPPLDVLGQQLAAIAGQTYPWWECIVVDDGSRDGTAAIARGLGDPRIRVLSLPHGGIVRACVAAREASAHVAAS